MLLVKHNCIPSSYCIPGYNGIPTCNFTQVVYQTAAVHCYCKQYNKQSNCGHINCRSVFRSTSRAQEKHSCNVFAAYSGLRATTGTPVTHSIVCCGFVICCRYGGAVLIMICEMKASDMACCTCTHPFLLTAIIVSDS
jgi:hypothetical protein